MVRRWLIACVAMAFLLCAGFASAQPEKWRTYLSSARQAFNAGRYGDAVRLLEDAHRLSNKDEILYNIAKASHFRFVEKKEPADLEKAVANYRLYLQRVPTGTRKVEATQALSELEPQLPKVSPEPTSPDDAPKPSPEPTVVPPRTGLVVTTAAENARIVLDGNRLSGSPLVAQTQPGMHTVRVEAPGYIPVERQVRIDSGVELAIDIGLDVQPAFVSVGGPDGASVYIDGKHVGDLPLRAPVSVEPGEHFVAISDNGRFAFTRSVALARGGATHIAADLDTTSQRYASYGMFAVGVAGLVVGGVLAASAVSQENDANQLQDDRVLAGGVSEDSANAFDDAVASRDDFRTAAVTAFGLSGAVLVTGLFLYLFDEPEVTTPPQRGPAPGAPPTAPESPGIEIGASPILSPQHAGAQLELRF